MAQTMTLEVEDFTGSIRHLATGVSTDFTVGDFVASVSRQMLLPEEESGKPIVYGAQTFDGEVLNAGDRLGDVVTDRSGLQLTRMVTAG